MTLMIMQYSALLAVATVSLLTCIRCCKQGKVGPQYGLAFCRVQRPRR